MIFVDNEHHNHPAGSRLKGTTANDQERIISGMTEMFRDPAYFQLIRRKLIPYLETFSKLNIWHAGCSTGEEAYSMSILLREADLLKRANIFATDRYEHRLIQGQNGRFSPRKYQSYSENYQASGLKNKLDDYLDHKAGYIQLKKELIKSINFFQHDLLLGASFNSFTCIFCRNVLIYYKSEEKDFILKKLIDSLCPMGFLILGQVENLTFSPLFQGMKEVEKGLSIYQKISA